MDPRLSGPFSGPQRSGITHPYVQLRQSHSVSRRSRFARRRPSAKTAASTLVTTLRQDSRDSRIQSCRQIIPHSKCYNTLTSMRPVINSDIYLCMMTPIIKRRNLSGYEKITTCKLCSYGDPKYLRHPLQLQHIYLHLVIHREGFTSNDLQNHYTSIFFFARFHSKTRIFILTSEGLQPTPRRCS